MKYLLILLAIIGFAPLANAQGYSLGSIMQAAQNMASGQSASHNTNTANTALNQQQSAVMQQALQVMASNPQLLSQMAGSLNTTQQLSLMQQSMALANQTFSPQEQASLNAFAATPEGQSIMAKLPGLIQQLAPVVLQMYAGNMNNGIAPATGR